MSMTNKNFRRWVIQGTIGILFTGAGISMVVEAGFYKHSNPPTLYWVLAGTGALIVLMTGLVLFVDSVRYRIAWDLDKRQKT